MKFMHCADVHLGGPNAQERLRTFLHMLEVCRQQSVQILLIAGDLFDAPCAEKNLRRQVWEALAADPSLCVLIAPGNHDPKCAGGNYDDELPENVYVFGAQWSCVEIAAYGVRVWGAGFVQEKEPPFRPQKRPSGLTEGLYDLGVLHGDLGGGASCYRSITAEAIAQTGVAYLALGHIHARSGILRAGKTYYAYSGCLQGAGFEDTGEKGAYLGTLDESGLHMSFVSLCESWTEEREMDVSGCADMTDMAQLYRRTFSKEENCRIRLILTGTRAGEAVGTDVLAHLLRTEALEMRVEDRTDRDYDYAALSRENTLRGAFVRRMQARMEQAGAAEKETLHMALICGLQAFEGTVDADED